MEKLTLLESDARAKLRVSKAAIEGWSVYKVFGLEVIETEEA